MKLRFSFSRRRRHTRCSRDWSSDVCSSDLLPSPFFVLATQNPIELEGTYPLPEAQLDRFLFNAILDDLSAEDELKVIDLTTATRVPKVEAVTSAEELLDFQQLVRMVPIAETLSRYVVALVRATRPKSEKPHELVKRYVNYRSEERRVGKECRSRWSPYH